MKLSSRCYRGESRNAVPTKSDVARRAQTKSEHFGVSSLLSQDDSGTESDGGTQLIIEGLRGEESQGVAVSEKSSNLNITKQRR